MSKAALSCLLIPPIEVERGLVHQGDLGTVAVLPFENLSGGPSLGFLGVGLAEDVRQRLLAQTDLKVMGPVSMASYSSAERAEWIHCASGLSRRLPGNLLLS